MKYIVDIRGEIDGDYEIIGKYEERPQGNFISREALKEYKFVGNKFVQIGGRNNGKTLESINKAYQQGWNDAIDAIIDYIKKGGAV